MSGPARTLASWAPVVALAALLYLVAGCNQGGVPEPGEATGATPTTSGDEPAASPASGLPPADSPALLSEWGQLEVRDGRLVTAPDVVAYSLNSPLFSDYAHKLRTVWLPDGTAPAAYDPEGVFDFPVGTVITKTFYYPAADGGASDPARVAKVAPTSDRPGEPLDLAAIRLVETRVLTRRDDGWHALPYVWNGDETEATLQRTGDLVDLTLVEASTETSFVYVVPDANQCSTCHATDHSTGAIQPIGLAARHLNTEVDMGDGTVSQLERWHMLGLLDDLPADPAGIPKATVWDDDTASLGDRARAYLDINCAHCHNRTGSADTSGLFLEATTELGPALGVCKPPVAAGTGTGGRLVGIHPGRPDDSIFVYRMATTDPGAMMPEVGRSLTHTEGVEVISAWIASLDGTC